MAASEFNVDQFEKKLMSLKDSQESIQSLSAWCLERRQHHKKIVATWLQVLKKVKVEHRLTLFYLANDVIQYSKRKNFEFVESWGTTLQRATTMVRDEKVKHRILRIFKIWDQRQVYDEEFLADLSGLISAAPKKKPEPQIQQPEEFQAAILISTLRSCATLEQATDARLRDLKSCNINLDNAEDLCSSLKDRSRVEDVEKEVEIAARNVENYVRALESEIRERKQVLDLLDNADQFYETQKGEVKIVVNAYRNFGSRVKNLKKKLEELIPMLTSPIPSPDINAPSPSPDSDIELPEEMNASLINVAPPTMYGSYTQDYNPLLTSSSDVSDFTNNFSSFMGGNVDFDMRNVFNETASNNTTQQYETVIESKSEIINVHPSLDISANNKSVSSFLKTVLPAESDIPECDIPGLGLDGNDTIVSNDSHHNIDYMTPGLVSLSTSSATLLNVPGTPILSDSSNNNVVVHSTPLVARGLNNESHTPSPYSSQNSQSNVVLPFEHSINSSVVNPLPPPPMPPSLFLEDEPPCYNKLPPKFPTWTFANETAVDSSQKWEEKDNDMSAVWPAMDDKLKNPWNEMSNEQWDVESPWASGIGIKENIGLIETPESPPIYEKSGYNQPVEYNDSQNQEPLLSSVGDVDHRVIAIPVSMDKPLPHRLMKGADVDHRNLISLTGSPANNNSNDAISMSHSSANLWANTDQDYRIKKVQPGDIVESVDMEMSDEENENKHKANRVLVNVRPQDSDMRCPMPPSQRRDMDMRLIISGGNNSVLNVSRSQHIIGSDLIKGVDTRPPPPPPPLPAFHSDFHENPDEYNKSMEFPENQGYHQSQEYLHMNEADFSQNSRDYDFYENQHNNPVLPTFPTSSQSDSDLRIPPFPRTNNIIRPILHDPDMMSNNQPILSSDMVVLNDGSKLNSSGFKEKSAKNSEQKESVFPEVQDKNKLQNNVSRLRDPEVSTTSVIGQTEKVWPKQPIRADVPKEQPDKINNLTKSGSFSKDNRHFINNSGIFGKKDTCEKPDKFSFLNGPVPVNDHHVQPNVYDYDAQVGRNKRSAGPQNPYSWRGSGQRGGRGTNSFRGGPRFPWVDRPLRPMVPSYSQRGMKSRGGPYRGGNVFRGRGRGGNAW